MTHDCFTRVEQRQNVRMLQIRRGLDLGQKPLGADDGGELGAQDLDRDLAVVLQILGEVHRGHAARAELPLDAVAVGEGGGETSFRHCKNRSRPTKPSPATRLNSFRFNVASRCPWARAVAPISRSCGPITVPSRARWAQSSA